LLESSAVASHPCQSTYGVNFSHRSNGSSSFFDNLGRILIYRHMCMSAYTTITTGIPLSPLAWKHWFMTYHTNSEHCTKAFVLGTSTKHYRSWTFWISTTHVTHISGAAYFKHKYLTNPSVSVTPESSNHGSSMSHGHSPRHQVSTTTHLYPPSTR